MLRLERAKERKIKLSVSRREPFFSKTLLLAIGIAFSLHAGAAVLFRVKPLKIMVEERSMLPVLVRAEVNTGVKGAAIAQTEEQNEGLPSNLEPVVSLPHLPEIIGFANNKPPIANEKKKTGLNPYIAYEHSLIDLGIKLNSPEVSYRPIEIHVSGPLAERKYADLEIDTPNINGEFIRDRARFAVKVDDDTGLIFWYEALELPQDKGLSSKSEEIVKNLRFVRQENTFSTAGEVEILFTRQS